MQLKGSVKLMPFVNYFNLRVSHWEPLLDPWEFEIHVRYAPFFPAQVFLLTPSTLRSRRPRLPVSLRLQ